MSMAAAALAVVEGTPVYGSRGGCLGYAAGVEEGELLVDCLGIRGAQGRVPLEWVTDVADAVRLCKSCSEVREGWWAVAKPRHR
jgi:hypothetical protein